MPVRQARAGGAAWGSTARGERLGVSSDNLVTPCQQVRSSCLRSEERVDGDILQEGATQDGGGEMQRDGDESERES